MPKEFSFDASRAPIASASQHLAGAVSSNFRLGMGPMILGHTPSDMIAAATAQMKDGLLYGGHSLDF
jgi:glutamate-1-semialdehyde aminotransferase